MSGYTEVTVVVDGALDDWCTFTNEDTMLQYISEVEAAAKEDGLPTQVHTLFHEHDEITAEEADAGDECSCIQYLQSHLPTYEWNTEIERLWG